MFGEVSKRAGFEGEEGFYEWIVKDVELGWVGGRDIHGHGILQKYQNFPSTPLVMARWLDGWW